MQYQRPHNGKARLFPCEEQVVIIRDQTVAQLHGPAVDVQSFPVEPPGFLISGSHCGMVPKQRGKAARFHPPAHQFLRAVRAKTPHVRAHERHAAHPQVAQLGDDHLQMGPDTVVVPGPGGAVLLGSRVAGPGDDEGPSAVPLL